MFCDSFAAPSKLPHSISYRPIADAVNLNGTDIRSFSILGHSDSSHPPMTHSGIAASLGYGLICFTMYINSPGSMMFLPGCVTTRGLALICVQRPPFLSGLGYGCPSFIRYSMPNLGVTHLIDSLGSMLFSGKPSSSTSSSLGNVIPIGAVNCVELFNEQGFSPVQFFEIKRHVDIRSPEIGSTVLFNGPEKMMSGSEIVFPTSPISSLSEIALAIKKAFGNVYESVRRMVMLHNSIYHRNHYHIIQNMLARI